MPEGSPTAAEGPVTGKTAEALPSTTTDSKVILFESCPADKTNLRILLVSGQKTDILCHPSDTVDAFLQSVFDNWPQEWKKDNSIVSPISASNMKLLHRGKFAERTSTLESNGFNLGVTTVVHILVKNDSPANGSTGDSADPKKENAGEVSCRCTIL